VDRLRTQSNTTMSASASRTYETQNDQQLDELHSKLRTLRSVSFLSASLTSLFNILSIQVTIDIHDETQRQNLDLDSTVCLSHTCRASTLPLLISKFLAGFVYLLRLRAGADNKKRRTGFWCWWHIANTNHNLRCCCYLCVLVWVEDYESIPQLVVCLMGQCISYVPLLRDCSHADSHLMPKDFVDTQYTTMYSSTNSMMSRGGLHSLWPWKIPVLPCEV
jgi:hypothetical protein